MNASNDADAVNVPVRARAHTAPTFLSILSFLILGLDGWSVGFLGMVWECYTGTIDVQIAGNEYQKIQTTVRIVDYMGCLWCSARVEHGCVRYLRVEYGYAG